MSNDTKALVKVISLEGYTTPEGENHPKDTELTIPWLQAKHAAGKSTVRIIKKVKS